MKILFLLIVAGIVTSRKRTSKPLFDSRIIGGDDVDIADYGWQISLLYGTSHVCGGAILNEDWVITAAHCFDSNIQAVISFRAGSNYTFKGGSVHTAEKIIKHPVNDVALVKVRERFDFSNPVIRAIALSDRDYLPGSPVIVTGWGAIQEGGRASNHLQGVQINIVDQGTCNSKYLVYGGVTSSMICAGVLGGGKDACQGDSGGPLVDLYNRLVGVVSWGFGCGHPYYPGVYVRIAHPEIRDFIRVHTDL